MAESGSEEQEGEPEIEALTPDLLDDTSSLIVAALAEGATHARAGEIAGVSAKTVQRRMGNPAFARVVAERRRERMAAIAGRLVSISTTALDVLDEILATGTVSERLRATGMVLDYGSRFHAQHLVELSLTARLDALDMRIVEADPEEWDDL